MPKTADDTDLIALDQQFRQLCRRATRLHRGMEGGTVQWSTWSSAMDEALDSVDRIASTPAHGLTGIAIKIGALHWFLRQTEAVLDAKGLRQLRALDREARSMAGQRRQDRG